MRASIKVPTAAIGLVTLAGFFLLKSSSNDNQYSNVTSLPAPRKTIDVSLTLYDHRDTGNICDSDDIFFVICVHSAPHHFAQRAFIRNTWGSVRNVKVRVAFVVGRATAWTEASLVKESHLYSDLVRGNFMDTYRNLSYKHVTGLRWASSECPNARFILKADDDAFVDIVGMFNLIRTMYPSSSNSDVVTTDKVLACNVHPAGGRPQRGPHGGKWEVTSDEVPEGILYPKYCEGIAYVTTPRLAKEMVDAVDRVPFLWIDDLYVTGMLANEAQARYHSLNMHTTHNTADLTAWLQSDSQEPCPYLVAEVPMATNQSLLLERLWRKTVAAWARKHPT